MESSTFAPGAGTYTPANDLSSEGKYILSKNQSAGKRKFMLGRRESFTEFESRRSQSNKISNLAPGPGTYRLPSDFGHYDETSRPSLTKNSDLIKTGRTTATSNARR